YTAEDSSFYTSLHAEFIPLDREDLFIGAEMINKSHDCGCGATATSPTWHTAYLFCVSDCMKSVGEIFHWNSLNDPLKLVLPPGYTYLIESFDELPSYQTSENFLISQFELKTFVDVNDKERVHE
ncbi:hypothetical protein RhiirA5_385130, partial [Rhizophagus irregularis]